VAIKALFDPNMDDKLKQEFNDELEIMARCSGHKNCIDVIGAHAKAPKMCMVMQLCSHSLFDWLHRPEYRHPSRGLPELNARNILAYALGSARSMKHLHSLNPPVVHRDLKAMNLFVDAEFVEFGDDADPDHAVW
jgi:serine/threonine protein kinase